jgi:hypothetical protein
MGTISLVLVASDRAWQWECGGGHTRHIGAALLLEVGGCWVKLVRAVAAAMLRHIGVVKTDEVVEEAGKKAGRRWMLSEVVCWPLCNMYIELVITTNQNLRADPDTLLPVHPANTAHDP